MMTDGWVEIDYEATIQAGWSWWYNFKIEALLSI